MSFFFNIVASTRTTAPIIPVAPPATVQLSDSDFEYNVWSQPETGFVNKSAFSTVKFSTTGTSVDIGYYTDVVNSEFLNDVSFSVFDVNNTCISTITPIISTSKQTSTLTLPSSGTYTIVEGGTIRESGTATDMFSASVVEITGSDIIIESIPINNDVVINVGDSISIGDGSTINNRFGYMKLLRDTISSKDFICEGSGSQNAAIEFNGDALILSAVNRLKSEFDRRTGRKICLFTLGTNDYGLNTRQSFWDARVPAFFDKFNELIPNGEIIIVSPLIRLNEETPNSHGLNLQWFRDSLQSLASTRSWVTYNEGKTVLSLPDDFISDGLHPNNAGHQKLADYIISIL
jgi:hypothetical protein